jgi:hypothetical protein
MGRKPLYISGFRPVNIVLSHGFEVGGEMRACGARFVPALERERARTVSGPFR